MSVQPDASDPDYRKAQVRFTKEVDFDLIDRASSEWRDAARKLRTIAADLCGPNGPKFTEHWTGRASTEASAAFKAVADRLTVQANAVDQIAQKVEEARGVLQSAQDSAHDIDHHSVGERIGGLFGHNHDKQQWEAAYYALDNGLRNSRAGIDAVCQTSPGGENVAAYYAGETFEDSEGTDARSDPNVTAARYRDQLTAGHASGSGSHLHAASMSNPSGDAYSSMVGAGNPSFQGASASDFDNSAFGSPDGGGGFSGGAAVAGGAAAAAGGAAAYAAVRGMRVRSGFDSSGEVSGSGIGGRGIGGGSYAGGTPGVGGSASATAAGTPMAAGGGAGAGAGGARAGSTNMMGGMGQGGAHGAGGEGSSGPGKRYGNAPQLAENRRRRRSRSEALGAGSRENPNVTADPEWDEDE